MFRVFLFSSLSDSQHFKYPDWNSFKESVTLVKNAFCKYFGCTVKHIAAEVNFFMLYVNLD